MTAVEGQPGQYAALRGIGLTVADQMPLEFWDVLPRSRRAPPDRARRSCSCPPSRTSRGSWRSSTRRSTRAAAVPVGAGHGRALGARPAPAAAAATDDADRPWPRRGLGRLQLPGWQRLMDAEAEAADLVAATTPQRSTPASRRARAAAGRSSGRCPPFRRPRQLRRRARHGRAHPRRWLGARPLAVRGTPLRGHPFVFLNACQVGRMGNSARRPRRPRRGVPVRPGRPAVIAPLWSIDDALARQIALRFYERALAGEPPAEILRRSGPPSATTRRRLLDLPRLPVLRPPGAAAPASLGVGSGAALGRARPAPRAPGPAISGSRLAARSARHRRCGSRASACAHLDRPPVAVRTIRRVARGGDLDIAAGDQAAGERAGLRVDVTLRPASRRRGPR